MALVLKHKQTAYKRLDYLALVSIQTRAAKRQSLISVTRCLLCLEISQRVYDIRSERAHIQKYFRSGEKMGKERKIFMNCGLSLQKTCQSLCGLAFPYF